MMKCTRKLPLYSGWYRDGDGRSRKRPKYVASGDKGVLERGRESRGTRLLLLSNAARQRPFHISFVPETSGPRIQMRDPHLFFIHFTWNSIDWPLPEGTSFAPRIRCAVYLIFYERWKKGWVLLCVKVWPQCISVALVFD